ncbi:MAG TPA: prepilin-type N-terminal cleavage/methylation domain-containing protein [Candidatus Acidoferrum sp.]
MKIRLKNGSRAAKHHRVGGFSLIELLIVVAIILIIAAIAIPNFIRARMAANESSAVSSIHAVNTAEIQYSSTYPTVGYSVSLTALGPTGSGYIDTVLAGGSKSGYIFTYVQNPADSPSDAYTLNADPVTRNVTGARSFYSDEKNVTHYNLSAIAASTDPSL